MLDRGYVRTNLLHRALPDPLQARGGHLRRRGAPDEAEEAITSISLQGDTSGCDEAPVDFKTELVF